MARKKNYQKAYLAWLDADVQLRKESEKYIKAALKKLGLTELTLSENHPCSIAYDGDDCEWNANPYSNVESVFFSSGELKLKTEDVCGYSISCIAANELHNIAVCVEETIKEDYDLK